MAISNEQETQILKLVAGLFNAAPGASNLTLLANKVEAGMTMLELSNFLASTTLFTDGIMGGQVTVDDQVAVLMNNFGLVPDGVAGSAATQAAAYFASKILAGQGFGQINYDAVAYLSGTPAAEFDDAAALLANKAIVAELYSRDYSSTDLTTLQSILAGVTATGPATEAEAAAYLSTIVVNPAQTTILTTDADNVVGTVAADIIKGNIQDDAALSTLNDTDTIDGGAGRDTLDLVISEDDYVSPAMTNVEIISVRITDDSSASIDFSAISGVDTIEIKNSPNTYAGFFGYNVGDEITTYKFTNVGNNSTTSSIDLEFLNTAFAGDADVVDVIVQDSGDAVNSSSADLYLENQAGDNVIEQYNVNSTGSKDNSYLYLDDTEVTTNVNLTGDNDIRLDIDDADVLTEVDASAFTGNIIELNIYDGEQQEVTVKLGSGNDTAYLSYDNDYTVTGGAGDDRLVFGSEINVDDSVDGGDGTDTLAVANSAVAAANALTDDADISEFQDIFVSIEALEITNTLTEDIDVSLFKEVQIVQLAATGAALIDGGVESGFTLGLADNATITIDMDNAAAGAADVLNVELNAENDTTFGVVEADDVETLNIAVTDVDGTDDADTDATFNASLNDVDTINVSGALDGTFTLTFDADVADKVDASGFDGNIILDASGNTDNITLIGGSGDDILTGGAGKDTMTGGDGDDIFAITDAPTVGTAPGTITDFSTSDDAIALSTSDSFVSAKIELDPDLAVFQDYLDAAAAGNASNDISWFQFGGNTYVVQDVDASATFANNFDIVVKLTGTIDLTLSTWSADVGNGSAGLIG